MPGCSHPGSASGAEEAHEIVTLGQFLHLLVVDPHQRANLLAENGSRQRPEAAVNSHVLSHISL